MTGIYVSRDGREAYAVVPSEVEIDGVPSVECVRLDGRARIFAEMRTAFVRTYLERSGDIPPDLDLVRCCDGDWRDLSRDDEPSDDPTLPRRGYHYLVAERREVAGHGWVRLWGRDDWLQADAFRAVR